MKRSAETVRFVEANRERILKLGGASAATLLTARDVAAMIGTTANTLAYYIKERGLPDPVMGGNNRGHGGEYRGRHKGERDRRWRLEDIQAYVQSKGDQTAVAAVADLKERAEQ
jgi:hypothetical protein